MSLIVLAKEFLEDDGIVPRSRFSTCIITSAPGVAEGSGDEVALI